MAIELPVGSSFAGYRIEGVIGRGGMGVLYLATQLSLERRVALKLISPEFADDRLFRERFKREARLAALIDHPNVIPVYEAGEWEGQLFLAMRYVDGTDLGAIIACEEKLHPRQAAPIITQVASALHAAHERGLVHRDVKPGNVLIENRDGAPHAYVTDFGLSKLTSSTTGLTRTGRWVGTVDYAAPEQVQAGETDARTDVYALGCVLYEALTGQVPFPRAREVSKIVAHVSEPPPPIAEVAPDCPGEPELSEIVRRAMAKDPADRYQSAGDLGRAVTVAAESTPHPESELVIPSVADGRSDVDRRSPTAG
ncbi:MAG: serine/threonine-protein kinase [Actinomycetota bacterium]